MSNLKLSSVLAAALLATRSLADCVAYGIDFQNGGSYFQNVTSTDPFTFVSLFEGCQDDVANNILVDPSGDEYQCSDTPLLPSDTNEMSTCPLDKDQLTSGSWSVLIISNNGNAAPIAYERDFTLTVGTPVTVTTTPTLTLTSVLTPVSTDSVTTTATSTITLSAQTTTVPSVTKSKTVTVTPQKVTTTKTVTVATVRKTAYSVTPVLVTSTHTATCSVPRRQPHPDPTCTITPTLVTAAALQTNSAKAKFRRNADRSVPLDREQRLAERKARLAGARALEKRSPDSATVTYTDTNTVDWSTITSTVTTSATIVTSTSVTTATSTLTPAVVTVLSGATTLPVSTVTAPTPTKTIVRYTIATQTVATVTRTQTITISKKYTPSQSAVVCTAKGGRMV